MATEHNPPQRVTLNDRLRTKLVELELDKRRAAAPYSAEQKGLIRGMLEGVGIDTTKYSFAAAEDFSHVLVMDGSIERIEDVPQQLHAVAHEHGVGPACPDCPAPAEPDEATREEIRAQAAKPN